MPGTIDVVFVDIGGVLYDDRVYAEAWRRALREAGAVFTDAEFDLEYAACRAAQNASFRRRLATRFLGAGVLLADLEVRAARSWDYPPDALHGDVVGALERLRDAGYRLGVIANQPSQVRAAMARDGLVPFFEVWAVSDDLGLQKPDPALFRHAIGTAGVAPERSLMAGDRLDYDIVPAKAAGMRTVWVLRGEAPDEPTAEQRGVPDAVVADLAGLPDAVDALAGTA
jgi:putative hydrolase of the HAD superfamily